ncbi:hypothetical protein [Pseudonocardia sp. GCM10023141]|uniref:hypothetical protein n=1 Tax=Pseudonocardia sp. GCM10023141 TaxID=3252653 RepID=UPI00360F9DFC
MAAGRPEMTARYRLTVAGPLPVSLAGVIRSRFGDVTIHAHPRGTELDLAVADQPALRALLTLLWDVGQDVLLVTSLPSTSLPAKEITP